MRLFCPKCFRFTDHITHCSCCDMELTVGDEVFKADDGNIYCAFCCGRFELEEPDTWEFERDD